MPGNPIREIVEKRDLIRELVFKDMRIRYAKPALGFFWSFFSPFFTVVIFYVVFSLLLRIEINEAPFFLYLMSAVFSWRFFSDSISSSLTSLIDNKNLIRESGVPQYFIPLSVVFSNAINYLPSLCVLMIASVVSLKGFPVFIVLMPLVLLIHLILTIGACFICSILYVKWRETKYILEVILQVLFYLTPAFYSLSLVRSLFPDALFAAYTYNPFVGILNLYRITVFRGFYPAVRELTGLVSLIVVPFLCASCLLFLGFYLFKKNKNSLNERLSY